MIGPAATPRSQCNEPEQKYSERIQSFTATTAAPSLAIRYHTTYCGPVLSYVAQLREPSGEPRQAIRVAHQRMLRFPHRALPDAMIGQLNALGIGQSDDPATMCAAAMMRTAGTMRTEVELCASRLHEAREQHSMLRALGDPTSYIDRREWQAPAVSDPLERRRACVGLQRAGTSGDERSSAEPQKIPGSMAGATQPGPRLCPPP